MGKSHIGLTYSQEINEILDKLANMVNIWPILNVISPISIHTFVINCTELCFIEWPWASHKAQW